MIGDPQTGQFDHFGARQDCRVALEKALAGQGQPSLSDSTWSWAIERSGSRFRAILAAGHFRQMRSAPGTASYMWCTRTEAQEQTGTSNVALGYPGEGFTSRDHAAQRHDNVIQRGAFRGIS